MKLDPGHLQRVAAETGFQAEPLERVLRLLDLLGALRSHPFLAERLVLKGGTALNLFLLDLPRLSVDVELLEFGVDGVVDDRHAADHRPVMRLLQHPEAIEAAGGRAQLRLLGIDVEHESGVLREDPGDVLDHGRRVGVGRRPPGVNSRRGEP